MVDVASELMFNTEMGVIFLTRYHGLYRQRNSFNLSFVRNLTFKKGQVYFEPSFTNMLIFH